MANLPLGCTWLDTELLHRYIVTLLAANVYGNHAVPRILKWGTMMCAAWSEVHDI